MNNNIQKLIQDVSTARNQYLDTIANVKEAQACWKPNLETWNRLKSQNIFTGQNKEVLLACGKPFIPLEMAA
jgi:hypothetical protein